MMDEEKCLFCGKNLENGEELTILKNKGIQGINDICKVRKLNDFHISVGQKVHKKCRARFVNIKQTHNVTSSIHSETIRTLRSSSSKFDFKHDCLFCGVKITKKHYENGTACTVQTLNFDKTILDISQDRRDQWGENVKIRVQSVPELQAAGACYHRQCSANFRTGKQIPSRFIVSQSGVKPGRAGDKERHEAFLRVAQYLEENEEEQITVCDLVIKMKEYLPKDGSVLPYSTKYMRQSLIHYFDDDIIITSVNGISDIVTFKISASSIINNFYDKTNSTNANFEDSKQKIILTAAELIKAEIKDLKVISNEYPTPTDIQDIGGNLSYLPDSLKSFLTSIVTGKETERKVSAIGQTIIQAVRPRVLLAPLHLG